MGTIQKVGTKRRRSTSRNSGRVSCADLRCETDKLLENAIAPNTARSYETGIEVFSRFLHLHNLTIVWPPPLSNVTQFIAYLSLTGKSPRTAKTYLAAISYQCKMLNYSDITSNFIVTKMIEGMKRLKPLKDSRLPITIELLNNMVSALPAICTSNYETLLFSAAFCLAFFGFLRIGEFSVVNNNLSKVFDLKQIKLLKARNCIELTIPFSKTDQYGRGKTIVIPGTGCKICPVRNVEKFLVHRPDFSGPFFCHYGGKPMTRYQFTAVLLKVLSNIGVDTNVYKSHSFRIGAASFFHSQGLSEDQIKIMGRWRSEAFQTYIRIPKTQV